MSASQLGRLDLDNMMAAISYLNLALLISYAALMGAAQIIFSNSANQIKDAIPKVGLFLGIVSSYWLYFGLIIYVAATVFWLFMLSRVDIRLAYPIASTAVIFASLFQCVNDGFYPSPTYWIGLAIIIFGLALINRG
jgi:drug/metabolite transporter (DMT)-like permease